MFFFKLNYKIFHLLLYISHIKHSNNCECYIVVYYKILFVMTNISCRKWYFRWFL